MLANEGQYDMKTCVINAFPKNQVTKKRFSVENSLAYTQLQYCKCHIFAYSLYTIYHQWNRHLYAVKYGLHVKGKQ